MSDERIDEAAFPGESEKKKTNRSNGKTKNGFFSVFGFDGKNKGADHGGGEKSEKNIGVEAHRDREANEDRADAE